ncbi:MAG: metallophosphoesterase [Myxococcota bacterium]
MRAPFGTVLSLTLAAGLATSCKKPEEAPKPPPPAAKPEAPKEKPAEAKLADPACVAHWSEEGEAKKIEVGAKTFELKGTKLTETSKDDDDQLTLGVVADIKEDTPENLANLEAIVKFMKEQKAEAIVVDGDLGDDKKQIENALAKLAESGLPVLAVIGNREGRGAFNEAVAAASARFPGVINLNQVRLVQFDDGALMSMPGYHNKVYIHAEDGCLYGPADLEASKPIVQAAKGKTLVLVSHGPPKQEGADALDRTLEQVNVGDPGLRDFLRDNNIKFGIFANIHEAGGRATNLSGQVLVGEGKLVDELYLSTGPADSVRWTMNDGTESVGMGGVLSIKGDKAAYKVFRVPHKAPAK